MTTKQQKYKKHRLEGMNPERAAVAAGYSLSYARARAHRIEMSAKVGMAEAFERAGLTDKAIITHALAGLTAMKLQSCNILISKPYAESVDADKLLINKNSNDFVEIEDWNARHKYFETILKLTNKIIDAPLIDQSEHTHLTLVMDKEQNAEGSNLQPHQETNIRLTPAH